MKRIAALLVVPALSLALAACASSPTKATGPATVPAVVISPTVATPASVEPADRSRGETPTSATAVSVASAGATAKCADGSLNYGAHNRGACSHNGGVTTWYK